MFIEINQLNKTYRTGDVVFQALTDVDFALERKEIGVILGPSGSGKSTLLNVIGGVDRADSGTVKIGSKFITDMNDKKLTLYRRASVGFIFQFYNLIPNLTVEENVEVATNISAHPMKVDDILHAVGLTDKKKRFPSELSGGQQQRVSIARAVAKNPELLLCDEPTGALDYKTSKDILALLEKINKTLGTTVLIITHNNAISGIADRVVRIRSGEITESWINKEKIPAERIEW
ncbi:ABC transporter ATP-binding protein [Sporolactobacillus shoreicorticis]|uniref:ABC transporter ATP-binding protein n=1 Tax=Sporolactobacillus shoreicorticis TaxID=1923877 RepID=A0ABW5S8A6_9BACL|nr:ABC transporter ATP-binding protein [Sporolactobacillus shoreicorticis]MCO7125523.1 ABC transporter ATP-binding protein [Sporolactobacillus shoreicorticis]